MKRQYMPTRQRSAMRRSAIAAAAALGVLGSPAWAASFSFSSTVDWQSGLLVSTNVFPPPNTGDGHVRLNDAVLTPFNHIWVALSGRDSVALIDTNAISGSYSALAAGGSVVKGEYLTRPNGMSGNPSRTTVDANGDVWVGNRNEGSGGLGSITKISSSATGSTSSGTWNGSTFNRLDWTNAGSADSNGGVSTAADSAILKYIRTEGANVRHVSVDKNNNVWAGGGPLEAADRVFQLYNGTTGAIVNTAFGASVPNNGTGGYGGLVDGNGIVWSAGSERQHPDPLRPGYRRPIDR